MSQFTIRKVSPELEEALRQVARRQGLSLNRTIVQLLEQATGLDRARHRRKRDLSGFSGRWSQAEAEEFDRRVEVFEGLDEEMWG